MTLQSVLEKLKETLQTVNNTTAWLVKNIPIDVSMLHKVEGNRNFCAYHIFQEMPEYLINALNTGAMEAITCPKLAHTSNAVQYAFASTNKPTMLLLGRFGITHKLYVVEASFIDAEVNSSNASIDIIKYLDPYAVADQLRLQGYEVPEHKVYKSESYPNA